MLDRGCVDAAVATLQAYRKADAGRMTSQQRDELSFHVGQALAMSGREREAIPHFESAVSRDSAAEWSAYVAANLGFVRKDRKQVEDALAAYEKVAGQTSMRLGFIRGFLRCPDRPYMEAASCGM
ncbi:hypothetical protein [Sphingomonas sp. URHD0057]|uniref:hypothetical protein n=1 Tax=Sphingomonas sp. URHD0057 TaxID=1380389 RepID=UPI000A64B7FE|nr:hypothetical protein [Sphingomonas sp. URHD0057]